MAGFKPTAARKIRRPVGVVVEEHLAGIAAVVFRLRHRRRCPAFARASRLAVAARLIWWRAASRAIACGTGQARSPSIGRVRGWYTLVRPGRSGNGDPGQHASLRRVVARPAGRSNKRLEDFKTAAHGVFERHLDSAACSPNRSNASNQRVAAVRRGLVAEGYASPELAGRGRRCVARVMSDGWRRPGTNRYRCAVEPADQVMQSGQTPGWLAGSGQFVAFLREADEGDLLAQVLERREQSARPARPGTADPGRYAGSGVESRFHPRN